MRFERRPFPVAVAIKFCELVAEHRETLVMRIAVTGSHGTGKTTLIEDLAKAAKQLDAVPEPHFVFESDAAFVDGPNVDDFEKQLNQSCDLILELSMDRDLIFDRCPIDFLAYLDVVSDAEGCEWTPSAKQLARVERAMRTFDVIIFVPVLDDDEITVNIEHPKLRREIDARLKSMLLDDDLGLFEDGPPLLEIFGSREQRVAKALAGLAANV